MTEIDELLEALRLKGGRQLQEEERGLAAKSRIKRWTAAPRHNQAEKLLPFEKLPSPVKRRRKDVYVNKEEEDLIAYLQLAEELTETPISMEAASSITPKRLSQRKDQGNVTTYFPF